MNTLARVCFIHCPFHHPSETANTSLEKFVVVVRLETLGITPTDAAKNVTQRNRGSTDFFFHRWTLEVVGGATQLSPSLLDLDIIDLEIDRDKLTRLK